MRRLLQALCVLLLGCGLCHAFSFSAQAAGTQPSAKATDPGVLFDRLDADHKGVLSASQIPADKRSLFERLLRLSGKPADGQLTRDEFVAQLKSITDPPPSIVPSNSGVAASNSSASNAAKTAQSGETPPAAKGGLKKIDPEQLFDRFDTNHKGKLTIDDVPEPRQKLFRHLLRIAGKPEGGALSKADFVKAVDSLLAKRQGTPAAENPESGKNKIGANAGQGFDVDKAIARLMHHSSRADGKLTKSDLPERMQARFDKIDANHDGLVDKAELRSWLNKVKRHMAAVRALNGGTGAAPENKDASKSGAGPGDSATTGSTNNSSESNN